jgi:hypothetical protein
MPSTLIVSLGQQPHRYTQLCISVPAYISKQAEHRLRVRDRQQLLRIEIYALLILSALHMGYPQEAVFEEISELVQSALDGHKASALSLVSGSETAHAHTPNQGINPPIT